jgi:hypothetical protein
MRDWVPVPVLMLFALYGYLAVFPEKLAPIADWLALAMLTLP